MTIVLIDYGAGNLHSVEKAFRHVAPDADIRVSNNPKEVVTASHIVLPGVGAFADCMRGLESVSGMVDALEEAVRVKKRPFFGICVGMQMMMERGHEHGVHEGLGWVKGEVVPIAHENPDLKVPHMGWNELLPKAGHPLLHGIEPGMHAYFVHSYHAVCKNREDVLATVDYGQTITAAIAHENMLGTQFHPEKSQKTGLTIIQNFMRL